MSNANDTAYRSPPWSKTWHEKEKHDPRLEFASLAALGAVTRLRHYQWTNPDGTIPEAGEHITQILGCSQEEFKKVQETVEAVFAKATEHARRDEDLHAKRVAADARREANAENGKKGGEAKARNDRERTQGEA
jgi:hypothetical protein